MLRDLTRVKVEFTPEFKRNLLTLAKKHRHILTEIQPVIDRLVTA